MQRLFIIVAIAAAAVGLYATTAGGGQQAVTPRQLAALSAKVTKLQKDLATLKAKFNCLSALGAATFGDKDTQKSGYVFKQPDGTQILTTALDLTQPDEKPQLDLLQIDPTCVSSFRAAK
jgi:hypothetical protein